MITSDPARVMSWQPCQNTTGFSSRSNPQLQNAGNQADDPNHRQDSYLYRHSQGPRKRFRSPADFYPHLLWLATDNSGDSDNCSCKICTPEDIQVFEKPSAKGHYWCSKIRGTPPSPKRGRSAGNYGIPCGAPQAPSDSRKHAKACASSRCGSSPSSTPSTACCHSTFYASRLATYIFGSSLSVQARSRRTL